MIFTHASLQMYLERLTHGQFSGSFFQYLPHYFADDFQWQGMHLWYLLVLFRVQHHSLSPLAVVRRAEAGACCPIG